MARSRTRSYGTLQGYATREVEGQPTVFYYDVPRLGYISKCDDEDKSPGKAHALLIERDYSQYEPLNGVKKPPENNPGPITRFVGRRPDIYATPGSRRTGITLPNLPSLNQNAATVISGSNPSRADVDLGVTIGELREAPQLFVRVGSSMLRNNANWWLSYQFGWKPFVNDLLDLLDVPPKVEQRRVHLERAAQRGYMRRRVQLGHSAHKHSQTTTIDSGTGVSIRCRDELTIKRRQWGTCKWVPSRLGGGLPKTDAERLRAARRAAYGLTVDPYTAWNLIPWSWLVDYFGNLGDVLEGYRNIVGLKPSDICIMTETEYVTRYTERLDDNRTVIGGTGSKRTIIKRRQVAAFVTPELTINMLNGSQLSNLAALGILRIPRDALAPFERGMFDAYPPIRR